MELARNRLRCISGRRVLRNSLNCRAISQVNDDRTDAGDITRRRAEVVLSAPDSNIVLIVDHDNVILTQVGELARGAGLTVLTAENGAMFRHALLCARPSLVLLDMQVPDMDGVDCMRHLATLGHDAEVVLMSALDPKVMTSARQYGRSLGLKVTDMLHKPVPVSEYQRIIQRHTITPMALSAEELRKAIEEYELLLHYQPIVQRQGNSWPVRAVEALVRWKHPKHGLLMPGEFLPLAEREGLMTPLTDFVLAEALRQVGHWHSRGWPLGLTVNLPSSCIDDVHFPDRLDRVLREHGVAADHLTFDVSEAALVGDQSVIMDSFARLRVHGVSLALDDFGVGTSSFTQLYKLPYTALKIDRALITETVESAQARTVVSALIELGHQLSLNVCAEGVHSEVVFDLLARAGCDQMQGDWLSAAQSPAALELFLRQWDDSSSSALMVG